MGGGDLNLKKSWHPQTMKNQEKVWKAEQAKSQEERKLNELRKEIAEEKSREDLKRHGEASGVLPSSGDGDKKLEWMYKKSTELINREEYLLGRSVDKSFEMLQAEERRKEQTGMLGVKQSINHVEHECIPFSIRAYRNLVSTEQVDLQRKVMEDPLMLIKQREMESRRKLLENPVKLKELHRILKTDELLKQKVKKSKKSKKAKKSKKKKKTNHSLSESESDLNEAPKNLDEELAKRYRKLNKTEELAGLNLTKLLDSKFETISKELDKAVDSKKKTKRRNCSDSSHSRESSCGRLIKRKNSAKRLHSRSPIDAVHTQRTRKNLQSQAEQRNRRRSRSRNRSSSPKRRERRQMRSRSRRRSRTPETQNRRRRSRSRGERPRRRSRSKTRSPVAPRRRSPACVEKSVTSAKKQLSAAEKEARLREMMVNAEWRETDRKQVVQKHREAYACEEEHHKALDFDKDFINKEVKKAIANQSSVGSRIRSNLNNIQRSSGAMDANFARK